MAGALKRENPDLREDVVLIRALRDSNLPKFLTEDAVLFKVTATCCTTNVNMMLHWYRVSYLTCSQALHYQNMIMECYSQVL